MAFADPQSITVNTIATSLPRVSSGVNTGGFSSNDGNRKLTISHSYGKRTRRSYRTDFQKIAVDPFTAANVRYSASFNIVADHPIVGFTVDELQKELAGFIASMTLAQATKFFGGEN